MPVGYTAGFGEPTCVQCHSGSLNPEGGRVSIGPPPYYRAGGSATITVSITDSAPDRRLWGFQLSARFRDGKQAGGFTPGPGTTVQTAPNGVQYVSHEPAASHAGTSYIFTVAWDAPPSTSAGDVVFSAAGMAADGGGTESGDHVFASEAISGAPVPARISPGGIVNSASYTPAPNNTAAPCALISIFGDKLSVSTAEALKIPLPFDIAAADVLIDGVPAPLLYVSPSQINAQVPCNIQPPRRSAVIVRGEGRPSSEPEYLQVDEVSPAIFTLDSSGLRAGAILHADFSLVDKDSPVKPGDWVLIFCGGLGQTLPPSLESGKAGAAQRTLLAAEVLIGGKQAPVDFAGAAPGFAGLYQINAIVPDLPAGDHEVIVRIGGRESPAGVTVAVQP